VTVSTYEELLKELVRLRRGWGVQVRSLRERIGPQVGRLCGITEADNGRQVQEKLRLWFQDACAELPPELARSVRVAFALDREYQHPTLTDRLQSLASEQSWGQRTARRRIDHATRLMAQAALARDTTRSSLAASLSDVTAVVRLDARRDALRSDVVVVRVPVPTDRFDLLIKFEAV
jgi:hypothetical protein